LATETNSLTTNLTSCLQSPLKLWTQIFQPGSCNRVLSTTMFCQFAFEIPENSSDIVLITSKVTNLAQYISTIQNRSVDCQLICLFPKWTVGMNIPEMDEDSTKIECSWQVLCWICCQKGHTNYDLHSLLHMRHYNTLLSTWI